MRKNHPVAMQIRPADYLEARQRQQFGRTELREIERRPRQLNQPCAATLRGRRSCSARHHGLDMRLHVLLRDAALRTVAMHARQIDSQLAREFAYRWRSMRQ